MGSFPFFYLFCSFPKDLFSYRGAEFVSPVWLYECLSQACYLPPPLFSPELKLGRSLGGVVTSSPTSGTKRKRKEDRFDFSRKRERLDFRVKETEGEKKVKMEETQKCPAKSKEEEELVLKEIVDILGMLQGGAEGEGVKEGVKMSHDTGSFLKLFFSIHFWVLISHPRSPNALSEEGKENGRNGRERSWRKHERGRDRKASPSFCIHWI